MTKLQFITNKLEASAEGGDPSTMQGVIYWAVTVLGDSNTLEKQDMPEPLFSDMENDYQEYMDQFMNS